MNVKLLREVAKYIADEPQRFIMGEGVILAGESGDITDPESDFTVHPPCGTAACIAGTAYVLEVKPTKEQLKYLAWSSIRNNAVRFLGLTKEQGERLFMLEDWPEKFSEDFYNAKSQRQRVDVGVARIEHFIKTKGAE